MGPVADSILDGGIVAIITAGLTWFGLAKHMERKYQTIIQAAVAATAQKIINEILDEKLDRVKKKTMFNNLICMRLAKELKIAHEEIDGLRKSCELNEIDLR